MEHDTPSEAVKQAIAAKGGLECGGRLVLLLGDVDYACLDRLQRVLDCGLIPGAREAKASILIRGSRADLADRVRRALTHQKERPHLFQTSGETGQDLSDNLSETVLDAAGQDDRLLVMDLVALAKRGRLDKKVAVIMDGDSDEDLVSVQWAVRGGWPVICLAGSGGLVDRLTEKNRGSFMDDPTFAEIVDQAELIAIRLDDDPRERSFVLPTILLPDETRLVAGAHARERAHAPVREALVIGTEDILARELAAWVGRMRDAISKASVEGGTDDKQQDPAPGVGLRIYRSFCSAISRLAPRRFRGKMMTADKKPDGGYCFPVFPKCFPRKRAVLFSSTPSVCGWFHPVGLQ